MTTADAMALAEAFNSCGTTFQSCIQTQIGISAVCSGACEQVTCNAEPTQAEIDIGEETVKGRDFFLNLACICTLVCTFDVAITVMIPFIHSFIHSFTGVMPPGFESAFINAMLDQRAASPDTFNTSTKIDFFAQRSVMYLCTRL